MNIPKYNEFNTGKTAGFFPLKRWRFDTEKHPIIQSKERCASSTTKTKFSTQELQMLVGLTNTLQCKEREAIRIALYEASKCSSAAYESAYSYASSTSTAKAHQGRLSVRQWKLPKTERNQVESSSKELGITEQEFIRLAIIWLQSGIRSDTNSIKKLTNSNLINSDAEATKWSRENQGKPPSPEVAKLKEARDIAYAEAGEIYKARNQARWSKRNAYLLENGFALPKDEDGISDTRSLDALIEIQDAENFERIVQEEIDKMRLSERESFEYRMKEEIVDITKTELDFLWELELVDAKNLSDNQENLENILEELWKEMDNLYTPEERKQRKEAAAKFNKDFSKRLKARNRWHKMSPLERRIKKRIENLFDAKD
jgi:hypothetical protein